MKELIKAGGDHVSLGETIELVEKESVVPGAHGYARRLRELFTQEQLGSPLIGGKLHHGNRQQRIIAMVRRIDRMGDASLFLHEVAARSTRYDLWRLTEDDLIAAFDPATAPPSCVRPRQARFWSACGDAVHVVAAQDVDSPKIKARVIAYKCDSGRIIYGTPYCHCNAAHSLLEAHIKSTTEPGQSGHYLNKELLIETCTLPVSETPCGIYPSHDNMAGFFRGENGNLILGTTGHLRKAKPPHFKASNGNYFCRGLEPPALAGDQRGLVRQRDPIY